MKKQRKPVAIRLSTQEMQTLKQAADAIGMGWTTFVRSVSMVAAERIVSLAKTDSLTSGVGLGE
tara:strand:- start:127 stop:318 length:192 start_codon:yes stop_codon:yes gene_type:complete